MFSILHLFMMYLQLHQMATTEACGLANQIQGVDITNIQTTETSLVGLSTIGFGLWTNYQPFHQKRDRNSPTQDPILLTVSNEENIGVVTLFMFVSGRFEHRVSILSGEQMYNNQYANYYQINNGIPYEGTWEFQYVLLDLVSVNAKIYYYLAGTQIADIQFITMQGPYGVSKLLRFKIVKQFLSKVSNLKIHENKSEFPSLGDFYTFANTCQLKASCQIPTKFKLLEGVQYFKDTIKKQTSYIMGRKYLVRGWSKLDAIPITKPQWIVVLKLSLNYPYQNNLVLGDLVFSLTYHRDFAAPGNNGFDVDTYVYDFPGFGQPFAKETYKESSMDFQQDLQFWTYFEFQHGFDDPISNTRFYMYLSNNNKEFSHTFNGKFIQISEGILYVSIGGDDFNQITTFQGNLANIEVISCLQVDQQPQRYCHISCQTCNGPSEFDCLTCSSDAKAHRQKSVLSSCSCEENYYDVIDEPFCKTLLELYPSVSYNELNLYNSDCEYGWFYIFTDSNFPQCIQCPQSYSPEKYNCGECYIYPKTWYQNPICTFDLVLYNNDQQNTYVKQARLVQNYDLYLIDSSKQLNYCNGCLNICTSPASDSQCNQSNLIHIYPNQALAFITCKPGYYYLKSSSKCNQCLNNCAICTSESSCSQCNQGYALNQTCVICPPNCLECAVVDQVVMCQKCASIYSLLNGQCVSCGNNCQICKQEQITNTLKYYNRCLKCIDISQYYVSFDGENCIRNEIPQCIYAYSARPGPTTMDATTTAVAAGVTPLVVTTMDVDFTIVNPSDFYGNIISKCSLCAQGYQNEYETNRCNFLQFNTEIIEQVTKDNTNYIIKGTNPTYLKQVCELKNCKICLQTGLIEYCMTCNDGYYSTCITGLCAQCPVDLNCQTCEQQNIDSQDAWKWKIKPYYRLVQPNTATTTSEFVFRGSKNSEDYEVICTACKSGYTMENGKCVVTCPISCNQCFIKNYNSFCSKCAATINGQNQSTDGMECLVCQNNCQFCIKQTTQAVLQVNPYFTTGTENDKYSYLCLKSYQNQDNIKYDSRIGQFIKCNNGSKCTKLITIPINVYCQKNEYDDQLKVLSTDDQRAIFFKQNVLLSEIFSWTQGSLGHFKYIETQLLFKIFNEQKISRITYSLTLISGTKNCVFPTSSALRTNLHKAVFSFQWAELILKSDPSYAIQLNQLDIVGFQKVSLIDYNVIAAANHFVNLENQYGIEVEIKNCQITSSDNMLYSQFKIQVINPTKIFIQGLTLNGFILNNTNGFITYQHTISQRNIELTVDGMYLTSMQFINSTLILIKFDQFKVSAAIVLTNFKIKNSKLTNSLIFNSNNSIQQGIGGLTISNFYFQGICDFGTMLINYVHSTVFSIKKMEIINSQFKDTSSAIQANSFASVSDLIVSGCKIENGRIIMYNITSLSVIIPGQFQFKNIQFINNIYQNGSAFINIIQSSSIVISVVIIDLKLLENNIKGWFRNIETVLPYQISNIYISTQFMILDQITVIRGIGYPEFSFIGLNLNSLIIPSTITITNFYASLSQSLKQQILHQDQQCLTKLAQGNAYSAILQFKGLTNIIINQASFIKLVSINSAFMIIESTSKQDTTQSETITISNVIFSTNLLLVTIQRRQTSSIQILSQQEQKLMMDQLTFQDNLLHQYLAGDTTISATDIIVISRSGVLNIKKSKFISNYLSSGDNSINHFDVFAIVIDQCEFMNSNYFDYKLIQKFLAWSYQSDTVMQETISSKFPSTSKGGSGYIIAESVTIISSNVVNSYGQLGGGFYLNCEALCQLIVNSTNFTNSYSNLQQENQFIGGGALYITGRGVTGVIQDTQFNKCYSRRYGCIYVSTISTTNTSFNRVRFVDTYSLFGMALYIQFASSNVQSQVTIMNTEFTNSVSGFNTFLGLLPDLSATEIDVFRFQASIISIKFGKILISGCTFMNMYKSGILTINYPIEFVLMDTKISDSDIGFKSLIEIQQDIAFTIQSTIILTKLTITNISMSKPLTEFWQNPSQVTELNYPLCLEIAKKVPLELPQLITEAYRLQLSLYNRASFNNYSTYDLSIVRINQLYTHQKLMINQCKLMQIDCSNCSYGIIAISDLQINKTKEQNNVMIQDVSIMNNTCGTLSCLIVATLPLDKLSSIINTNSRRQLTSDELEISKQQQLFSVLIQNSKFINNKAAYGGGVGIFQLGVLINQCEFINNQAQQQGGAIYYVALNDQKLLLFDSVISENTAGSGGGLYTQNFIMPNPLQIDMLVESNVALQFGSDVVENPQSLTLSINGQTILLTQTIKQTEKELIDQISIAPYFSRNQLRQVIMMPSGQVIKNYKYFSIISQELVSMKLAFRIVPLNKFKQQLKQKTSTEQCSIMGRKVNLSESYDNVLFTNQYTSESIISYNTTTQDYNLDHMIIKFDPNYIDEIVLQLEINCPFVKVPIFNKTAPFNIIGYIPTYKLRVNIQTFDCQMSEYKNETEGTCLQCDPEQQQYQVTQSNKCEVKDDISTISVTYGKLQLKPGYWRPSNDSIHIESCYHNTINCDGGWNSGDNSCFISHIGALCEQCDLYNIRGDGSFSVSAAYQCGPCAEISGNSVTIVLISIWTLISIFLSVKSTLEVIEQFTVKIRLMRIGLQVTDSRSSQSAILMKIFTNYLQIVSTITTFQLQLPSGLVDSFGSVGNPIQSMAYSLDCFLANLTPIDILYFRLIWSFIMPFLYVTLYFAAYGIVVAIGKSKYNFSVISTTLIYIYLYLQPSLIGGLISLISFRTISQVDWVQGNVAYRYNTDTHWKWLIGFVMPALIFIGIILPLYMLVSLYKQRHNLNEIVVRKSWGYLYNEYRKLAYFWEIVKIGQKELIIIFLAFYEDKIMIKAAMTCMVIYVYFFLAVTNKPYQQNNLNKLDLVSTLVCAISIILGSTIYQANQSDAMEIVWPFYILIILVNCYFIFQILAQIINAQLEPLQYQIDKIRDKIREKFPNLIHKDRCFKILLTNQEERRRRVQILYRKLHNYLIPVAREAIRMRSERIMTAKGKLQENTNQLQLSNIDQQ